MLVEFNSTVVVFPKSVFETTTSGVLFCGALLEREEILFCISAISFSEAPFDLAIWSIVSISKP